MAVDLLGMRTFSRSGGEAGGDEAGGSVRAAAYRAGERIRDERTRHTYDYRHRAGVIHKEIVLPGRLAARGANIDWARDRARLWNAAEHAEGRGSARVAREFTLALPRELAPAARSRLARQFAQHVADRYQSAVDIAIHAPQGDAREFHAHLLSTTREVTPEGLGSKTTLELSGPERDRRGLPRWRDELLGLREHWTRLSSRALEHAHASSRVSGSWQQLGTEIRASWRTVRAKVREAFASVTRPRTDEQRVATAARAGEPITERESTIKREPVVQESARAQASPTRRGGDLVPQLGRDEERRLALGSDAASSHRNDHGRDL